MKKTGKTGKTEKTGYSSYFVCKNKDGKFETSDGKIIESSTSVGIDKVNEEKLKQIFRNKGIGVN